MLRQVRLALGATALGVAVTACGSSSPSSAPTTTTSGAPSSSAASTSAPPATLQNVTFTLNFTAGGPQAGFMYAKQLGYYKQAGLNVKIIEGTGSVTTAEEVASGKTDLGFSDAPSVMSVAAKGGKVEVVSPVLQTNGFSIMSLKSSNITSVKDLVGKTIGLQPGTAQTALLSAIFASNQIPQSSVHVENISSAALIGTLLQHKVDAILGGADFQAVQIEQQGAQLNQLLYKDIGVPTVGLSIISSPSYIAKNANIVREFISASMKGWKAAQGNPQAAAQAVATQFPAAGTLSQYVPELKVDLGLLCAAPGATHMGQIPDSVWLKTYQLLTTYDQLSTSVPASASYTTSVLPTNLPSC